MNSALKFVRRNCRTNIKIIFISIKLLVSWEAVNGILAKRWMHSTRSSPKNIFHFTISKLCSQKTKLLCSHLTVTFLFGPHRSTCSLFCLRLLIIKYIWTSNESMKNQKNLLISFKNKKKVAWKEDKKLN